MPADTQKYSAVQTAAGDVQLTIDGAARELSDVEAVDLALSLMASGLDITDPIFDEWADFTQQWINAQASPDVMPFESWAARRAFVKPPATPDELEAATSTASEDSDS